VTIKVYRDEDANAAILETGGDGSIGMRFNNELRAIGNGDGTCSILNPPKSSDETDYQEFSNIPFGDFVDQQGNQLGATEVEACNALNALLRHTGGPTGEAPVITSQTAITVSDGDSVNYSLVANNGIGYEWANLPAGLSVQNGNLRKLIGTISSGPGVYTPTMTATNYYGQDSETLTITVTSSFANTKSIDFEHQDWMGANAALLDAALGRSANGSGSGDAWTISLWFKPSSNNQGQTIFYFGSADIANGGHIELRQTNSSGQKRLRLRYGTNNNYLQLVTANGSITAGQWHHILITYDGGTTGSASGSVNDYYSRFEIKIDNVVASTSNTHNNYGYSGSIIGQNLRVGRYSSGGYMRGAVVDELAIWGSDQSSNSNDIYNSGTPHELTLLANPPAHWWRMGDGDTYPTIQDNVGSADFVMYNMTAADIINDVP
jgi:hypothetical protein